METGPVTRSRRNVVADTTDKENTISVPVTPTKKTGKLVKTELDTANLTEKIQDKMNCDDIIASPMRITRSRRSLSVCSNPPDSPSKNLLKRAASPNSPRKLRTPVRELTAKKTRESTIDKNASSNEMTPTKRLSKIKENSLLTVDSPKPRRTRVSLTESELRSEVSNLRRSRRLSTELNVVEEDPIKEAIVELPNVSRKRRTKTLSVVPTEPTLPEEIEIIENEDIESEADTVSDKANSVQNNSENLKKSDLVLFSPIENLNKSSPKISSPNLNKSSPKISSPNLNKSSPKISSPNLNKSVVKISPPNENLNRSTKISSPKENLNKSSKLSPTRDVKDISIVLRDCRKNSITDKNEQPNLSVDENDHAEIDMQKKKITSEMGLKSPKVFLGDIQKSNVSIQNMSEKNLNETGSHSQSPNLSIRKNSMSISGVEELNEDQSDFNKSKETRGTDSHNQSLNNSLQKISLVILSDDEDSLTPNQSTQGNLNKNEKLNVTVSPSQSLNCRTLKNSPVISNDSNQTLNNSIQNDINKSTTLNEIELNNQSLTHSRNNSTVILNFSNQDDLNQSGKLNRSPKKSTRNDLNNHNEIESPKKSLNHSRKSSLVTLNDINEIESPKKSLNRSRKSSLMTLNDINEIESPKKSLNRSRKSSLVTLNDINEMTGDQSETLNKSSNTSQSSINDLNLEESPKNSNKRLSAKEIFMNENISETNKSEDKKKINNSSSHIELMEVDRSSSLLIIDDKLNTSNKNDKRKSVSDADKSILSSQKSDVDSSSEDEDNAKDTFLDLAEDAGSDYQSGDSMNESEKLDMEENEIIERGHSLNSDDTEEEDDVDDTYEKDSFVCSSDEEDDALLSGTGDDLSSGEELTQSSKSKAKFNAKSDKQRKNASREMYSAKHDSPNTTKSPNNSGKNRFSASRSEFKDSVLDQTDEKEISIVAISDVNKDPLSVTLVGDSNKSISNSLNQDTTESSSDDDERQIRDVYNDELQKLRNIEYVSDTSSDLNLKDYPIALNKSVQSISKSSPKVVDNEKTSKNKLKASKKSNLSELNKSDSMLTKKSSSNRFNSSLSKLDSYKDSELQASATIEENLDRLRRLDESIKNIYSSVINTVDQVKCSVDAVVHGNSNLSAQSEKNNLLNVFKRKLSENNPPEEKPVKKICVSEENSPKEIQKSAYEVLNTKSKRKQKKANRNSLKLSEKSKTIKRSRNSDVDLTAKKVVNVAAELQDVSVPPRKTAKDIIATSNFEVEEVDVNKKINWTGTAGKFHITEKAIRRSIVSDSTTSFNVVSLKKHPKHDIKVENVLVADFVNFKNDMLYGKKIRREPSTNIKKNIVKIKAQQAAHARK